MNIDLLQTIPKIDAHMHIWDVSQRNNLWLTETGKIDFRYGDYQSIRQNYLLNDYQMDFSNHHIIGSIFVETEWRKWQIKEEINFVKAQNPKQFIKGVVCQGWLDQDFTQQLPTLLAEPTVKGIRQKPVTIDKNNYQIREAYTGTMLDPNFISGLTKLADNNLLFEVQTAWWHLPELLIIKEKLPTLKVVINHVGMPTFRDTKTITEWQSALKSIAHLDDVYLKISGFGEKQRWEYARNKIIYETVLDLFPSNKLLFASNFPVDKVVVNPDTLMAGFYQAFAHLNESDVYNIFYNNAINLYNLDGESL